MSAARDGKTYPQRPVPAEETDRAVQLAHQSVCQLRMSHREALKRLEQYGVRRSTGWISRVLSDFECDRCREGASQPAASQRPQPAPEPAPEPERKPARVHSWLPGAGSGYLTSSLDW